MEKASLDTNRTFPLCREGILCDLPHPSGDGRDQSSLSLTPLFIMNCGMRIAEFGIKSDIFFFSFRILHSEIRI